MNKESVIRPVWNKCGARTRVIQEQIIGPLKVAEVRYSTMKLFGTSMSEIAVARGMMMKGFNFVPSAAAANAIEMRVLSFPEVTAGTRFTPS